MIASGLSQNEMIFILKMLDDPRSFRTLDAFKSRLDGINKLIKQINSTTLAPQMGGTGAGGKGGRPVEQELANRQKVVQQETERRARDGLSAQQRIWQQQQRLERQFYKIGLDDAKAAAREKKKFLDGVFDVRDLEARAMEYRMKLDRSAAQRAQREKKNFLAGVYDVRLLQGQAIDFKADQEREGERQASMRERANQRVERELTRLEKAHDRYGNAAYRAFRHSLAGAEELARGLTYLGLSEGGVETLARGIVGFEGAVSLARAPFEIGEGITKFGKAMANRAKAARRMDSLLTATNLARDASGVYSVVSGTSKLAGAAGGGLAGAAATAGPGAAAVLADMATIATGIVAAGNAMERLHKLSSMTRDQWRGMANDWRRGFGDTGRSWGLGIVQRMAAGGVAGNTLSGWGRLAGSQFGSGALAGANLLPNGMSIIGGGLALGSAANLARSQYGSQAERILELQKRIGASIQRGTIFDVGRESSDYKAMLAASRFPEGSREQAFFMQSHFSRQADSASLALREANQSYSKAVASGNGELIDQATQNRAVAIQRVIELRRQEESAARAVNQIDVQSASANLRRAEAERQNVLNRQRGFRWDMATMTPGDQEQLLSSLKRVQAGTANRWEAQLVQQHLGDNPLVNSQLGDWAKANQTDAAKELESLTKLREQNVLSAINVAMQTDIKFDAIAAGKKIADEIGKKILSAMEEVKDIIIEETKKQPLEHQLKQKSVQASREAAAG